MLEVTRMRTNEPLLLQEKDDEIQHGQHTDDWERFKGPPSASEWAFGSARRSSAGGQAVGAHAQHGNEARPRFHAA